MAAIHKASIFTYCLIISALLGAVIIIFWTEQARFLLPTPKPDQHYEVAFGERPDLSAAGIELKNGVNLLHFYNPDCPCSRFNLRHFQSLLKAYNQQVGFYIVTQAPTDVFDEEAAAGELKVLVDQSGEIADLCGVYATPQAVVLDQQGSIIYRGNYNRARFCTSRDSWFTQMVLDSELGQGQPVQLSQEAFVPYGCNLPSDQYTASGLMDVIRQLMN